MSSEADGRAPADARTRWIARLGSALLGLLARTWRFRVIGREPVNALRRAGRPVAFAFWHGQMLPLVVQHRDEGVAILVSSHRDGEIIARIIHRFGFRTVRGSSSRGAGRALLGLVRELQAGREIAVTPDGPRGPARRFAPGALVAAQRAGAPVIPVSAHAARAWRLRSWDAFMIPKPFTRVTVAYGPPTPVSATSARDAAAESDRFEALLAATEAIARRG
jgi:lysophospholipid acyltransferase (LPLAT)-like uncharacterized protein